LEVKYDNQEILLVNIHRHLGLNLSSDCKWSDHIQIITKSAISIIYLTYIRPILEYATCVWDNQVPEHLQEMMPPLRSDIYNHNLRFCKNYQIPLCRLEIMNNSFVSSSVKLWNRLEDNVKDSPTLGIFKNKITKPFKPPDYFDTGNRYLSIILAHLHLNCSSLNGDIFRVNIINSPLCTCGQGHEDVYHYFFLCSKFDRQR